MMCSMKWLARRSLRIALVGVTGAGCVTSVLVGSDGAWAGRRTRSATVVPGPVARKVLAAVNVGGIEFVPIRARRTRLSKRAAVRDAVRLAPWRGSATGVSLARTTRLSEPTAPGTMVWVVSIRPRQRVAPVGGGPAGRAVTQPVDANYFVVAVSARTARLVIALDGYRPLLGPPSHSTGAPKCRAPSLVGLTVQDAAARANAAHCPLRFTGTAITESTVQTIEQQQPAAGQTASQIVLTVNPACSRAAAAGPPGGEPYITRGPTELIVGLYLSGGPPIPFSNPGCIAPPETPHAGTIIILNPDTKATAATQTVTGGQLATFPLAPGSYMITGSFADAFNNTSPMRAIPVTIDVASGESIRQDIQAPSP